MPLLALLALPGLTLFNDLARAQPTSVGYLDSDLYPIRVHYPAEAFATLAATVLAESERIWEAEVVEMGFDPPMTEDASGTAMPGLWIYLAADSEYAHAVPVSDIPGTSFTDCTSRMILPTDLPEADRPIHLARECLHAMEMAVDCIESPYAFESTAVAVTVIQYPEDPLWLSTYLPSFQASPHLGMACTFLGDATLGYYHYGAALLQLFLDEWIGEGNGRLLPRFWRAARQAGWVTVSGRSVQANRPNYPDFIDGIATVLAEEGTSFDEAYSEFALWRYCVGANDDGTRFRHGAKWMGGEVTVDATHVPSQLPLVGAEPTTLPQSFGTIYVELDVRGIEPPMGVIFSFAGDADSWYPYFEPTWHVGALRVTEDGSVTVENVPFAFGEQGEIRHRDLGSVARLVWAISVTDHSTYQTCDPHPEAGFWLNYGLRIEDMEAAPRIDRIAPNQLAQGSSQLVTVTGASFLQGIIAYVEGGGVVMPASPARLSENELWVRINVDEDAAPGPRTLILANLNGHRTLAENGFAVVQKEPPAPTTSVGCFCQDPQAGAGSGSGSGSGSGGAPLGLLVLLGGLLIWKRRSVGRGRTCRGSPLADSKKP